MLHIPVHSFQEFLSCGVLSLLGLVSTTVKEILKIMTCMKTSNIVDYYGMSSNLLTNIQELDCLVTVINETVCFPDEWKISILIHYIRKKAK